MFDATCVTIVENPLQMDKCDSSEFLLESKLLKNNMYAILKKNIVLNIVLKCSRLSKSLD